MSVRTPAIALERRLRGCRNVLTLGVKPNFSDYSPEEAALIRAADKIYYPATFYADLFNSLGKATFPSYHTYKCVQDKIKQTALFEILQIPHPRTRVFYGRRQKARITDYFDFPFVAKVARGSALGRGVFLIRTPEELAAYTGGNRVAYIQAYLAGDRDVRVVVIGNRIVHAYWRIASAGQFRSNLAAGAAISLDKVPDQALELAQSCAAKCGWDDVGLDIRIFEGRCYVLEANMKYGKEGFRKAGIDYRELMEKLIAGGVI